jgi:hypothetical protein
MATGRIGVTPTLRTRWSKLPTTGTTVLSGLDDNSVALVYDAGYEAVYRNGVLLSRGNDYTATDGTTVTLIDATLATDIIEIFANDLVPLTDAISKGQYNAKGALLSATAASTPAVLAVGTNDQVLTADSSTSTGLKWATASAGGMTQLATGTLSGASVAITSISGAYKDLILVLQNIKPVNDTAIRMRFNNDTNNRYKDLAGNSNNESFADDYIFISGTQDSGTALGMSIMRIHQYSNTVCWKTTFLQAWTNNETTPTNANFLLRYGAYNQTTAISQINLFPASGDFTSGTYILYGVS